jgi:hypothetical protein
MGLIPFATLTNGKQALIERFAITVAPSISTVGLCGKLYENKVYVLKLEQQEFGLMQCFCL